MYYGEMMAHLNMADQEEYNAKLDSLRRYIPFLVNMMSELKVKGNREAQLTKIQSLHDMITDTRKKLKLETLNRCEEVLTNIYFKVNPQLRNKTLPEVGSPRSTPASPSPPRDIIPTKPITIPTEKVQKKPSMGVGNLSIKTPYYPKIDVYSHVVINNTSKSFSKGFGAKVPDMSKPPISLDDLKTLEEDVHEKMSAAQFAHKTVDELQEFKKQLELQIRVDQISSTMSPKKSESSINTTVRNSLSPVKRLSFNENNKTQESPKASTSLKHLTGPVKEIKYVTLEKKPKVEKEDVSNKPPIKKVIVDAGGIFGSLLSSIDDKLLEDKKKVKKERRPSVSTVKEESKTEKKSTEDKDVGKPEVKDELKSEEKESKDKKSDRRSSLEKKDKDNKIEEKKEKSKSENKDGKDKEKSDGKKKEEKDSPSSKDKKKDSTKDEKKKDETKTKDKSEKRDGEKSKDKEKKSLKSDDKKNKEEKKHQPFMKKTDKDPENKEPNKINTDNISSVSNIKPKSAESKADQGETSNSLKSSSAITIPLDKSSSSNIDLSKPVHAFKRLADKYNPKPRKSLADAESDIDKAVSDRIEENMKVSPAKLPATSLLSSDFLPEPQPPPASLVRLSMDKDKVADPKPAVQLPDILQKFFNKPLGDGLIPKINENRAFSLNNSQQRQQPSLSNILLNEVTAGKSQPAHNSLTMLSPPLHRNTPSLLSPPQRHPPEAALRPYVPNSEIQFNLHRGFNEHSVMEQQHFQPYNTPRADFDTPSTPLLDFESPRVDFEPPPSQLHMGNHFNQRFIPPESHRPVYDNMNENFRQYQPETYNGVQMGYYGAQHHHQMPLLTPEVSMYMPEQKFYQERWNDGPRGWGRDRRPGDPRNYREYKEMKEREAREAQEKELRQQNELKDPRLGPRESFEKDINTRDPRLARDKSVDRSIREREIKDPRISKTLEKDFDRGRDKERDQDSRGRERSRDFRDRPSRDPRDRESRSGARNQERSESRSEGRYSRYDSKFDKMYSRTNRAKSPPSLRNETSNEDDESFTSPLDSLYNNREEKKTGKGYGVQNFRIPRKPRRDDVPKKEEERRDTEKDKEVIEIEENNSNDSGSVEALPDTILVDDDDSNDAVQILEEKSEPEKRMTRSAEKKRKKKVKEASVEKVMNVKQTVEAERQAAKQPDIDTSRIKVVINTDKEKIDVWHDPKDNKKETASDEGSSGCTDVVDSFVSEYDREFQETLQSEKVDIKNSKDHPEKGEMQVEEPSSSQDLKENVLEKQELPVDSGDAFKKPTETDSIKKTEAVSKVSTNEPAEQNILAHFFENLLKSNNKKDKKSALFSLIETFSDSFDEREIHKIRKIIKVNDESDDSGDETGIKGTKKPEAKAIIEEEPSIAPTPPSVTKEEDVPVVGSTTDDIPKSKHRRIRRVSSSTEEEVQAEADGEVPNKKEETQVNEVTTKSCDQEEEPKKEEPSLEENKLEEETEKPKVLVAKEAESIIVSVGERTKSRKRNTTPPKPKKKAKSELDLLHEDIQDMFIRDGVLTATGKRMCRILKDDPNALSPTKTPPLDSKADSPKKVRKKPGPKPKPKINKEDIQTMKSVRVLIKKIPDDVMQNKRELRSMSRKASYAESDEDDLAKSIDASNQNDVDESDKSDSEDDSSDSEDDDKKSQSSDSTPKPKAVKKRRGKQWASGIIPKNKKKKAQTSKSKENSPERTTSPLSTISTGDSNMDKLVEPDTNYYYDYSTKDKIKCKLCAYTGHSLIGHYLKEHPDSEVLCSRMPPQQATEAIKDFSVNGRKYESILNKKMSIKYNYSCRVCGFSTSTHPLFFYEHATTHTGEYRHHCGLCDFISATGKTLGVHFLSQHPNQERKANRRTYTLAVIFGYMCGECNFLQLKEKNVEDHINIFHLGERPTIYKINLSTVLDPRLEINDTIKVGSEESKNINNPPDVLSESVTESETAEISPPKVKKRRKPGPRSKTVEDSVTDDEPKEKEPFPCPVIRKKPGPKSKTMVKESVVEDQSKEAAKSIETPPVPIRRKPGPKSKTQTPKLVVDDSSTDDEFNKQKKAPEEISPCPTPPGGITGPKKTRRKRTVDKLISEESGDDLDTIIAFSSRGRAAKEKATAKLKSLMESNEGVSRKRSDIDARKEKEVQEKKDGCEGGAETMEIVERVSEHKNPAQMSPPAVKDKLEKDAEMNVFTCKTDIHQEESKIIEEDRLRKMEELNKSIGSRLSKLDFVDKLCNRLNNDQVKVKEEPKDVVIANRPETPTMPVLEKQQPLQQTTPLLPATTQVQSPLVGRKPVLEEDAPVRPSSVSFRQNKSNTLFSNMIEKLQGKVNEASEQEKFPDVTTNQNTEDASLAVASPSKLSEVFISIGGMIKATKVDNYIIFSCHTDGCYVATKDKMVFQLHCKFGHRDLGSSSLCDICGIQIIATQDTNLLENLYDHLVFAHSDFIEGNLFAKPAGTVLRMRRLSGDKLSVKKEEPLDKQDEGSAESGSAAAESEVPEEQVQKETAQVESMETQISATQEKEGSSEEQPASIAALQLAEDNPFSFKIVDVMSLAEEATLETPTTQATTTQATTTQATITQATTTVTQSSVELPPLKPMPPLTLIGAKQQTVVKNGPLIVKEAKLSQAEVIRNRKCAKALQKFIETPGDLYKCPHFYCMFSSNVRTFMERHLKMHSNDSEVMIPCVYCDMKTPWEHVPMHIDIRHAHCRFACSYCLYRAWIKEYVCLHQEHAHPTMDFVVIALPVHRAAKKFSVADLKTDYKALCEPYRCVCKGPDGLPNVREYLFETEFTNHLITTHKNNYVFCGYSGCSHKVSPGMMLNHWAVLHGVCTYQCAYCKTSYKVLTKMYNHFALLHPSMQPDILVRACDTLPVTKELGYSKEAFDRLGHIKTTPINILAAMGKKSPKSIKMIHLSNQSGSVEGPSGSKVLHTGTPSTTSPSTTTVKTVSAVKSTQGKSQYIIPNPSMKFIVASTNSNGAGNLYLVPATDIVSQKTESVTSTASMSKVLVHTSTASKAILAENDAVLTMIPPRKGTPAGSLNAPTVGSQSYEEPARAAGSSHSTISVLSKSASLLAGSSVVIQKPAPPQKTQDYSNAFVSYLTNRVPKAYATVSSSTQSTATVQTVPTQSKLAVTTSSKQAKPSNIISSTSFPSVTDSSSTIIPVYGTQFDSVLDTAVSSILLDPLMADDTASSNSPAMYSETSSVTDDPELSSLISDVLTSSEMLATVTPINNSRLSSSSKSNSLTSTTSKLADSLKSAPTIVPTPSTPQKSTNTSSPSRFIEHIEVAGDVPESPHHSEDVDPLNLDADDSNLEVPLFEDINVGLDSPPEDPLTITPTLNTNLPASDDPLNVEVADLHQDPLEVSNDPVEDSLNLDPIKAASIQRSSSMVSNSDDESDSCVSEKGKKRGLLGYQLFRCASCNMSFSNMTDFRSHVYASKCKTLGPKPYKCVHCERAFKTPHRLCEHIQGHGIGRFACSLCTEKFPTVPAVKVHIKSRHSIHQTILVPLKADRTNPEIDEFVAKPCQSTQPTTNKDAILEPPRPVVEENSFTPDQLESIPIRQIFSQNVKCGLCSYQTKVRVNILRHLQMHLDEKAVSETAPVNPVPCLEKNEKMFDKMINLAASSITGRMGGSSKGQDKEEEKFPEFVPTHCRFVCCAQGCSYLCPEEGNLKHHLMALHSDETDFTCAHCKLPVSPNDAENVIKHFKLHGLHLYKCHYCSFVHNLKHKIERHINDNHLDVPVKVATVRYMESEPQEFGDEPSTSQVSLASKFKPWRCRMCKWKCAMSEEIQSHILHKHDIDSQYKCTLCAYKSDERDSFKSHFIDHHPSHEIDMICVYEKIEEEQPKDDALEPFDTTPLWQRDKPRVRHIRGILFEEMSPQTTKSPKKPQKTSAAPLKAAPSSNKNLFDCIDAVAKGTAETLLKKPNKDSTPSNAQPNASAVTDDFIKEVVSSLPTTEEIEEVKNNSTVIIIDSDDESENLPKAKDKDSKSKPMAKNRGIKRAGATTDLLQEALKMAKIEDDDDELGLNLTSGDLKTELVELYGGFGTPHNKQWKCPRCNQFKSKRVGDFIFHIYKDLSIYRFKCKACSDLSITYKYMTDHIKLHPGFTEDIIEPLPSNVKLETWIHMVIREQSLTIIQNSPSFKKRPLVEPTSIGCIFCEEKFMSIPESCEHMLYHWSTMPYECQYCTKKYYTPYELKLHHKNEHPNMEISLEPVGPTLIRAMNFYENFRKRPKQTLLESDPIKKPRLDPVVEVESKPELLESDAVVHENLDVNSSLKESSGNMSSNTLDSSEIIKIDSDDDLVVVSKTEVPELPNEDLVFVCGSCPVMADTEILIQKHIEEGHSSKQSKKFKTLSKKQCEANSLPMACNICHEIGSELKLRRHFLNKHSGYTFNPYRYKCQYCLTKCLKGSAMKMHHTRMHLNAPFELQSIVNEGGKCDTLNQILVDCNKLFKCSLCTYQVEAVSAQPMKQHIRTHLKPMSCNLCGNRFSYVGEVRLHHKEKHSGKMESFKNNPEVMREFNNLMKKISRAAMPVIKATTSEMSVVLSPEKNVAKKSTSTPFMLPSSQLKENGEDIEEGYSFYGVPEEMFDLKNISTTFELDGLEYTTTAEQIKKMFNFDAYVDLSGLRVALHNIDYS